MSSLRITAAGATDIGRRREHNEDALLIDEELGLFVVADGVGGMAKGEVASHEAIEQVHNFVRRGSATIELLRRSLDPACRPDVQRLLESAVQNACYLVHTMGEQDPSQRGMSTTLSALLIVGDFGVVAQVGDSRVYRRRGGRVQQLTEDHTLVNDQVRRGLITAEQAKVLQQRNIITRAVGHKDYVQVDTQQVDTRVGDRYLLCSDGLHGYVEQEELLLLLDGDPTRVPQALIDLANGRGGKDNITAVLVDIT